MKKSEFCVFLSARRALRAGSEPYGVLLCGFCTFKLALKPGTSGWFHCCSRRRQWKQQRQCLLTSMDHCVPARRWTWTLWEWLKRRWWWWCWGWGGGGTGAGVSRGIMNRNRMTPHSFLFFILLNVHHPDWTINRRTTPSRGSEIDSPNCHPPPLPPPSRRARLERHYYIWRCSV